MSKTMIVIDWKTDEMPHGFKTPATIQVVDSAELMENLDNFPDWAMENFGWEANGFSVVGPQPEPQLVLL